MPTSHGVLTRRHHLHPARSRHQVLDARSLADRHRHGTRTLRPLAWKPPNSPARSPTSLWRTLPKPGRAPGATTAITRLRLPTSLELRQQIDVIHLHA
ncbi:hypothetical protein [Streptomyces javensis]|uniref:Uncharacterized protein n=1 Tax=Streptomyces javensis TaxID=114698 RepID=A0ABS0R2M0_9ACTN|nr:hypothetical protein [Streptomyces javensis]MBI0311601.1 hypothetical protein [Streptomyces javensis]